MRLALDTNRYVDFCRGDPAAVAHMQEAERIYLPFVTLAELRAGFLCGTKARQNERVLTRFLNSPRVRVLFPDDQTIHHYARLFQQLRQQATPIPTNDIWIAALVLQHDLPLYARDRHFDFLPQLVRI
jgi:tRNA(fMet)-specific endonuclease VapC